MQSVWKECMQGESACSNTTLCVRTIGKAKKKKKKNDKLAPQYNNNYSVKCT